MAKRTRMNNTSNLIPSPLSIDQQGQFEHQRSLHPPLDELLILERRERILLLVSA